MSSANNVLQSVLVRRNEPRMSANGGRNSRFAVDVVMTGSEGTS